MIAPRAAVSAQVRAAGFCVLRGIVPAAKMVRVAAEYDRAFAAATASDLKEARSGGSTRLTDLVTRDTEFDELHVLDPVLCACIDTIGPQFKLSSFSERTVQPGAAAQGLHVDVRAGAAVQWRSRLNFETLARLSESARRVLAID